ncbi:MAG TPA: hypothetical protein VGQ79_07985 [Nitrospiraceae bacterium]|jgi:hypothetical protein|nr:hypothetical protein [Nitrospiraceae bacterium]
MTFYFRAHRTYLARDRHNSRRWWRVYKFETSCGVITLKQPLVVRRIITKKILVYED